MTEERCEACDLDGEESSYLDSNQLHRHHALIRLLRAEIQSFKDWLNDEKSSEDDE